MGIGGMMLAFYTVMSGNKQVASRHLPVAHSRSETPGDTREAREEVRRISETRLQAAVVPSGLRRDESDPYADVPCTD